MKTFLKKLVPGLVLFSLLGTSAFAQTRVAVINLQKVFDGYYKTKQADAALKDRASEMDKSHKEMLDTWKKAKDDYQKLLSDANDQAVSAEERDKRKKGAEDKLRDIKAREEDITAFERQAGSVLAEQKARMRKNIIDEIRVVVSAKAKSGNYSLVVDSGALTYFADPMGPYYTPAVLYNSNENDLTDGVLSQMNAGAPVDLATPDEKKDPTSTTTDKKDPMSEKKPADKK